MDYKIHNLIRSDEEKAMDMLELNLGIKQYAYTAMKFFMKRDEPHNAKRVERIVEYFDMKDKVRSKDRLEPSGQWEGLMFIGINPSSKSGLVDVWKDSFGKYFGKMLDEAGIDKTKIWMTNLYKKATPENRPLTDDEIKEGIEELKVEILYINPKMIVALGKQVSTVIAENFNQYPWKAMYHPAYLIRNNSPDVRSKYLLELINLKKYE